MYNEVIGLLALQSPFTSKMLKFSGSTLYTKDLMIHVWMSGFLKAKCLILHNTGTIKDLIISSLLFTSSFRMFPCGWSMVSAPLTLGLAMRHALTYRMWWKGHRGDSRRGFRRNHMSRLPLDYLSATRTACPKEWLLLEPRSLRKKIHGIELTQTQLSHPCSV